MLDEKANAGRGGVEVARGLDRLRMTLDLGKGQKPVLPSDQGKGGPGAVVRCSTL